jgi:hypothetical protein
MDKTRFDALSRGVGPAHSRRTVARLLAGSLVGSLGLGGVGAASARRRRCRPPATSVSAVAGENASP